MTRHCGTPSEDALVFHLRELGTAAYAVDSDRQIVFWNAAATQLLGYSAGAVIGRRCSEVLSAHAFACCQPAGPGCGAASMSGRCDGSIPLQSLGTAACGQKVICVGAFVAYAPDGDLRVVHLLHEVSNHQRLDGGEPGASTIGQHRVSGQAIAHGAGQVADMLSAGSSLTPREHQVLRLLATGLPTAEIAQTLSISSITARNHITSVIEKLGVRTRLQAVLLASRAGLV